MDDVKNITDIPKEAHSNDGNLDDKTNVKKDAKDLLTNTTNNNNVSSDDFKEDQSLHSNDYTGLQNANGQDVNSGLVNNGPPDLLGDISNNQKQTISLSKVQNNLLNDTQKFPDETMMNE